MPAPLLPLVALLGLGAGALALWRGRRKDADGPTTGEGGAPSAPSPKQGPVTDKELALELQRRDAAGWAPLFEEAEKRHGLPPGLISAIGSRETGMQDIVGDGGHGRGVLQMDDRSQRAWLKTQGADAPGAKPPVAAAAMHAGEILVEAMAFARKNAVALEDELKFSLSAYNAGPAGALKGYHAGDSDRGTTKQNYGADVLRRWRGMGYGPDGRVA